MEQAVTNTESTSMKVSHAVNGVDLDVLMGTINAISDDARMGICKFRASNQFGGALNALTNKQITRIRLAADHYLQRQKLNPPCRFDVIAMNIDEINWLQGCF